MSRRRPTPAFDKRKPRARPRKLLPAVALAVAALCLLGYRAYSVFGKPAAGHLRLADDVALNPPHPVPVDDSAVLIPKIQAAEDRRKAAETARNDPDLWLAYAREAMSAGDLLGAREGLKTTLRFRPNAGPVVEDALGRCELRLCNYPAAREHFQRVLTANPQYGPAYIGLSRAQMFLGQRKEAAATLAKAEEKLPESAVADLTAIVEEHEERGDLAKALRVAERMRAYAPPGPEAGIAVGRVLFKMERFEYARYILEALLRDQKDYLPGRRYLAALLNAPQYPGRDSGRAEEIWLETVQRDPADTSSLLSLGRLYLDQNRSRPAAYVLVKLLEIQPDSADARMLLSHAYSRLGDQSMAAEQRRIGQKLVDRDLQETELDARMRQAPADAQTHFELGAFYLRNGLLAKALEELQAAHAIKPWSEMTSDTLRSLYQRLNLPDLAGRPGL